MEHSFTAIAPAPQQFLRDKLYFPECEARLNDLTPGVTSESPAASTRSDSPQHPQYECFIAVPRNIAKSQAV